jgi:hypothetical protein
MATRLDRAFAPVAALALLALAACQTAAPAERLEAPAAPSDGLHELVDRRVLSSRPVNTCLERWGKGAAGWFEVEFEIDPSGRLTPLEAHGGDANLNACLFAALGQVRLPPRSVPEPRRASISIR